MPSLFEAYKVENGYMTMERSAYLHPENEKLYYSLDLFQCDRNGHKECLIPQETIFFDNEADLYESMKIVHKKYNMKENDWDAGLVIRALRNWGWDARAVKEYSGEKIDYITIYCFRKDTGKNIQIKCFPQETYGFGRYPSCTAAAEFIRDTLSRNCVPRKEV